MNDQTWMSKIDILTKSALKKFSKEEFDKLVLQAHIYGKPEILEQILTSKKKKNRYFKILDQCYLKLKTDESSLSVLERGFILKIGAGNLVDLIEAEAKKFSININNPSFSGFKERAMSKLKNMYNKGDPGVFELNAKEILRYRNKSFCFKIDFVYNLHENPTYAYSWSKYFNLKRTVPKFIRNFDETLKADADTFADEFIKLMKESALIFGHIYHCIFVTKLEALEEFIQTCFIQTQPQVLAITVKTLPLTGELVFLQLACKNWICVIDIRILTSRVKQQPPWKKLLEYIYDPAIERIGFDFESDYNILMKRFSLPHISNAMKLQQRKGLSLKKLIQNICENSEAKVLVFWAQKLDEIDLSNVAKTLLEIELDEDKLFDNWIRRPLSDQQKTSLLNDTVALLLLKEKIESDLKWIFGETAAAKIIQEGCISIGDNLTQCIQCKRCLLSKAVIFPTLLYTFLHSIYTLLNDGSIGDVNWNQFRHDVINFKEICVELIDCKSLNEPGKFAFTFEHFRALPISQRITLRSEGGKQIKFSSLFSNPTIITEILYGLHDGIHLILCLNCPTIYLSDNEAPEPMNDDEGQPHLQSLTKGIAKNVRKKIHTILEEIFSPVTGW